MQSFVQLSSVQGRHVHSKQFKCTAVQCRLKMQYTAKKNESSTRCVSDAVGDFWRIICTGQLGTVQLSSVVVVVIPGPVRQPHQALLRLVTLAGAPTFMLLLSEVNCT